MTRDTPADRGYMEMAYGLAEQARGRTSPNPLVGAVIVKDGRIVGTGYHEEAGKPHAEIIALRAAGRRAKGATLYLTLEPCVHWGRTPPCVDAVLEAGLARVVISAHDPNPVVHTKGAARLKRAGLDVSVGLLAARNARLNEAHAKFITTKTPFVTLKAAASLDGKIATRTGDSKWISSEGTREYVHLLRGGNDALLVGVDTLIADDPLLTVRHPSWPGKKLTRVILDSRLRFPADARILGTRDAGGIIVFARRGADRRKADMLRVRGVEVVEMEGSLKGPGLGAVLAELGRREVAALLVEGGARVHTSFLGGRRARGLFEGAGADKVADAFKLRGVRTFSVESDIILEGYF
jgi:diaminohydroxyphosphoribosylaminopyrimidine deaminase/5-amino-6-(5-phosphoribosylamino)uracil reductase